MAVVTIALRRTVRSELAGASHGGMLLMTINDRVVEARRVVDDEPFRAEGRVSFNGRELSGVKSFYIR